MSDPERYLETKILNAINGTNMETILHWIPAHIGVLDHDIADKAAKDASNTISIEKLPISEILNIVKSSKQNEWLRIYDDLRQNKGLFYKYIINAIPRSTPWFKNLNINSNKIKLINRLRSGHCFDKKTLNLMHIEDNNLCQTCNTIENAEHIIITCKRFNNVRSKYRSLSTHDYKLLLRNENTYVDIFNYLNEIQYYL